MCQTPDGEAFYDNTGTQECSWDHPLDEKYRQIYLREKALLHESRSQAEYDNSLEASAVRMDGVYIRGRRQGVHHDAPLATVETPPPSSPLVRGMRYQSRALPHEKAVEPDLRPAAWRTAQPAPWITESRPDTAPPPLSTGGGQLSYALSSGNPKAVIRALREVAKDEGQRARLSAALAQCEQEGWQAESSHRGSRPSSARSSRSHSRDSPPTPSSSGPGIPVVIPWYIAERKARSREIFGTTRLALAREQARGKLLQKKYARREKPESDPNMDRFYWSHTKMPREQSPCHPGVEENHGPLWFVGQPKKLDLDAVRRKYRGYMNKP